MESNLSTYFSIPSVTFRHGHAPSDTHLLRSLSYKTLQCDVSNRCLLSKYSHTITYGSDGRYGQDIRIYPLYP